MKKTFLLMILAALLISGANAQTLFSPVDSKLTTTKSGNVTELTCSGVGIAVKFQLKYQLTVMPQNNLVTEDGQTIQITPLKFGDGKQKIDVQSKESQKTLLDEYTKYELAYFKNDLGIEMINPSNQWVMIKGRGWFIWYFKLGNVPVKVDKQTKIQLFASTVVGDNILTINAPILSDGDFNKAGLIVNDMMEALVIAK